MAGNEPEQHGEPEQLSQSEVESLLKQAQEAGVRGVSIPEEPALAPSGEPRSAAASPTPQPVAAVASSSFESPIATDDIELLLTQAERALASAQQAAPAGLPPGVAPFKFEDFSGAPASTEAATIELIRDVELDLKIELGRTQMYLEDVLKLRKGSVVPLDKLAGDPVDIIVNGRLIARGEVLVLNDNFCVRVAELVSGETTSGG
jgi:flagellar motor switch protein FliN/FliY